MVHDKIFVLGLDKGTTVGCACEGPPNLVRAVPYAHRGAGCKYDERISKNINETFTRNDYVYER